MILNKLSYHALSTIYALLTHDNSFKVINTHTHQGSYILITLTRATYSPGLHTHQGYILTRATYSPGLHTHQG